MADFFDSEAEVSDEEDVKLSSDEDEEEEGDGKHSSLRGIHLRSSGVRGRGKVS